MVMVICLPPIFIPPTLKKTSYYYPLITPKELKFTKNIPWNVCGESSRTIRITLGVWFKLWRCLMDWIFWKQFQIP